MSYKLPPPAATKTVCPVCGKRISKKGLTDHLASHKLKELK